MKEDTLIWCKESNYEFIIASTPSSDAASLGLQTKTMCRMTRDDAIITVKKNFLPDTHTHSLSGTPTSTSI